MKALRRPSWWAWCLLAFGLGLTGTAGMWQYGKAQYKREREARWAEARQRSEVPLSRALKGDSADFDRVRMTGTFGPQRYLLDNQVRNGRPGVEVFAPMRSAGGIAVLAALGWLPYGDAARRPPGLPPVPADQVELTGMLAPPPAYGLRLGRDWAQAQTRYPKLMPYFALDEIASDAGMDLAPRVLRVDPAPDSPYRRDWRPIDTMPPARHLAYAWQWWFLSMAMIVIFFIVHRRSDRNA